MRKERKRNRFHGFDYSQDNLYFITICVHERVCCFGNIIVPTNNNVSTGDVGTGRDLSDRDAIQSTAFTPGTGRDLSLPNASMILNEYGKIAEQQWYWLEQQFNYVVLHEFVVMPNHVHGIIEIDRGRVGTGRDLSTAPKIKSLSELIGAYKMTVSKKDPFDRCRDKSRLVRQ